MYAEPDTNCLELGLSLLLAVEVRWQASKQAMFISTLPSVQIFALTCQDAWREVLQSQQECRGGTQRRQERRHDLR